MIFVRVAYAVNLDPLSSVIASLLERVLKEGT